MGPAFTQHPAHRHGFSLHATRSAEALRLSGRLPGGTPQLLTLPWITGVLEFFGGLLLLLGLFTRPIAFILSGMMAVAYFKVHARQGLWPLQNRGELAALYCFVFLYLSAAGGGPWSLDSVRRRGRA